MSKEGFTGGSDNSELSLKEKLGVSQRIRIKAFLEKHSKTIWIKQYRVFWDISNSQSEGEADETGKGQGSSQGR